MWGYCKACRAEGKDPWHWLDFNGKADEKNSPDLSLVPQEEELMQCRNHEDNCRDCGKKIEGEEWLTAEERHEFWGAPCSETICVGYICSCGYREEY